MSNESNASQHVKYKTKYYALLIVTQKVNSNVRPPENTSKFSKTLKRTGTLGSHYHDSIHMRE